MPGSGTQDQNTEDRVMTRHVVVLSWRRMSPSLGQHPPEPHKYTMSCSSLDLNFSPLRRVTMELPGQL